MKKIVVIGSINVDLVTQVDKRPKSGETIMGRKFQIVNGGKGANQAVAVSRIGADVNFIGCVGNDVNGEFALENLLKNNIKITGVAKLNGIETGIANIVLSEGDNSIIVVPGANFFITKEHIHQHMKLLLQADMVILQLEIPMNIIEYVVDICYKNGIKTILNPAPAADLSRNLINKVSYLTPNEHEFELMFKTKDLEKVMLRFQEKLIVTRGSKGVCFCKENKLIQIQSIKVDVVDTTGAGDTFNGALAYGLVNGKTIIEAVKLANKAAAISVTKFGAQGGMPTLSELELI